MGGHVPLLGCGGIPAVEPLGTSRAWGCARTSDLEDLLGLLFCFALGFFDTC